MAQEGKPVAPPPPPPIKTEVHRREGRWLFLLLYLIVALVIAVAVVVLGRWIYRSAEHNNPKRPSISQKQTKQPAKTSGLGKKPVSSPKNSASNSIANTGPGNLAGVFVVSAAAAGSLHYVIKRRQNV